MEKTNYSNYEIITDSVKDLTEDLQNAYHIRIAGFDEAAEEARRNDKDVLFIGSADAALATEANGHRIVCVDAKAGAPGLDFLVLKLSRLRAAGATLEEAASYFEQHLPDAATLASIASRMMRPIWSPEVACG